jgi:hypothetical protein
LAQAQRASKELSLTVATSVLVDHYLQTTKAQVIAAMNVWQKLLQLSSELPSVNTQKPSILLVAIDASTAVGNSRLNININAHIPPRNPKVPKTLASRKTEEAGSLFESEPQIKEVPPNTKPAVAPQSAAPKVCF